MAEKVEVWVTILGQTENAYRVTTEDDDEVWLPKSQVAILDRKENLAQISIPDWLALDKGMI